MTGAIGEAEHAAAGTPGDARTRPAANLREMLDQAASRWPEKKALADAHRTVTHAQLREEALAFAGLLVSREAAPGERVAILATKRSEAVAGFLGAAGAGCSAVAIDHHGSVESIGRLLDWFRPAALLVEECFVEEKRAAWSGRDLRALVVIGGAGGGHGLPWREVAARWRADACRLPELSPGMVAYLNMTSGSTGQPKAIATTHANLLANTRAAVAALGMDANDVHLSMFPFYGHPHESFMRALSLGGTAVLHENLRPASIAEAVRRHGVTCLMAATTIHRTLAADAKLAAGDFSGVRVAECGGMHLCPSLHREFQERLGIALCPVWGSTETAGIALAQSPSGEFVPCSTGVLCPSYEAMLVDESGEPCLDGEPGELLLRGPGVCEHRLSPDGGNIPLLRDGWLHTGDIFRRNADGHHFFQGRKSGMLKVAGMRVYPGEIENVLEAHPAVREAAVCGMPHPSRGEVPAAFVVVREECPANEEDLRAHCRGRLPAHKVPKAWHVVPSLPKSPGGKILYRELAAAVAPIDPCCRTQP